MAWLDRKAAATVGWWLLMPLLALDLLLIGQHLAIRVLHDLGLAAPLPRWASIGEDRSLSEVLNWAKWVGIALLLLAVWARTRLPVALGFAVAFAMVALDDILSLHEGLGAVLAGRLGLGEVAGLRGQDLGELLVWSAMGVVVVGAVVLGLHASDRLGRQVGRPLLSFLGALLVFAVGFDMVHAVASHLRGLNLLIGTVEDGGEMVVGSLCLAYCAALLVSRARLRAGPGLRG